MYTGLIAKRYATALYNFASHKSEEEQVYIQTKMLINAFSKDDKLMRAFISPITTRLIKIEAVENLITPESLCSTLKDFINLTIKHHREKYFFFMLHSFVKVYKERNHITDVVLTTAMPLSEEKAEKLATIVSQHTEGNKVEITKKVNPDIIGGFILRVNNQLINASLARQLSILKQKYEK